MSAHIGKSSTAEDVLALQPSDGVLCNKVIIVTGGNTGIGLETVRTLANAGARIIMTSRNVSLGEKALKSIETPDMKGKVTVHELDLSDLNSIKAFTDTVTTVDILICNAGIVGGPLSYTKQGFEQNIGVNHVGHFYLTQLLLPKLKASGTVKTPSRVVVVASLNYEIGGIDLEDLNYENRKYNPIIAYSNSKLATMLFARQLAHRMKAENAPVSVVSLHPGLINTGLTRNLGLAGYITRFLARMTGKSIPQGAATSVYCATASGIPSGSYWEDCCQKEPKPNALDDEMARKLWEKTEELIANKT
ncbi:hypothetical protein Ndes2526B_g01639 [Nannochloris sp. 'desiccata']|nr:putative Retinol dehydrogenase 14 [Chlorella desiccata (nom. nud.)]